MILLYFPRNIFAVGSWNQIVIDYMHKIINGESFEAQVHKIKCSLDKELHAMYFGFLLVKQKTMF
jgi:hypothetical protein